MMRTAKEIGNIGEDIAEKYLKKRFWRILSRNYKAHGGEIDIIAYRFGVLCYFEVKARSNDSFGKPSDAVDDEKLARIRHTARDFVSVYCIGGRVPVFYPFDIEKNRRIRKERIDVIEIYLNPDKKSGKVNHIKDWGNRV